MDLKELVYEGVVWIHPEDGVIKALWKLVCYKILHRISELAGSCEHRNEALGMQKWWGISW